MVTFNIISVRNVLNLMLYYQATVYTYVHETVNQDLNASFFDSSVIGNILRTEQNCMNRTFIGLDHNKQA